MFAHINLGKSTTCCYGDQGACICMRMACCLWGHNYCSWPAGRTTGWLTVGPMDRNPHTKHGLAQKITYLSKAFFSFLTSWFLLLYCKSSSSTTIVVTYTILDCRLCLRFLYRCNRCVLQYKHSHTEKQFNQLTNFSVLHCDAVHRFQFIVRKATQFLIAMLSKWNNKWFTTCKYMKNVL